MPHAKKKTVDINISSDYSVLIGETISIPPPKVLHKPIVGGTP